MVVAYASFWVTCGRMEGARQLGCCHGNTSSAPGGAPRAVWGPWGQLWSTHPPAAGGVEASRYVESTIPQQRSTALQAAIFYRFIVSQFTDGGQVVEHNLLGNHRQLFPFKLVACTSKEEEVGERKL